MAYLGNQPVIGDSTNKFKILDNISSFTLTFDGSSASVVSVANDTLSIGNHRFITGQKVTYSDGGGTVITGLTDGTSYFIIKESQTTIKLATSASNAASSTAIDLTGLGAGASHTLNVKFDGTNTKFKITHNNGVKSTITRPEQLSLSINGVIQNPASDYSIESDSTLALNAAPVATDKAFGSFVEALALFTNVEDNTIDEFTGDGSTTTFNLSKEPPSSRDIMVAVDGVIQYPTTSSGTRAYNASGSQLVFTVAPAFGVVIQARHIGFAAATSSSVTAFYGRTGNVALRSTDNISVNELTAAGNVSIGGTLTYEDVTNVDSVGLITARNGISITGGNVTLTGGGSFTGDGSGLTGVASTDNVRTGILDVAGIATFRSNTLVGSGITLSPDGNAFHTGIVTATSVAASGVDLTGLLKEDIKITNGKLSDNTNIDLENGMVHYFITTESTTSTPNIRYSSSETLNSKMSYGESISVTIITNAAAAAYSAQLSIDGTTGFGLTHWVGGSAPSDGGSSGVDIYAYTIIKIGDATFKVIGNQSKTS